MKLMVPVLPSASELKPFLEEIDATKIYSNGGPLNARFCNSLSEFIAGRLTTAAPVNLTAVSSGTAAIEIALRLRATKGLRWVILPSFTFVATAHAVANAGYSPWFVDIDPQSWATNPDIVERALNELPEKPAGVVVVSPFGAPLDIEAWDAFEIRTGIPVVIDMAASVMSIRRIGLAPICLSLHATKMISTGEGGAILSRSRHFNEDVARTITFGFGPHDRVSLHQGGNYRVSEFASAIGLAALANTSGKEAALNKVASFYKAHLESLGCRWPTGFGKSWISMTLNVEVPAKAVEAIIGRLDAAEVPWRRWWSLGCHTHPAFAEAARSSLDTTLRIAPTIIGLPFHQLMTESDVRFVCATVSAGADAVLSG